MHIRIVRHRPTGIGVFEVFLRVDKVAVAHQIHFAVRVACLQIAIPIEQEPPERAALIAEQDRTAQVIVVRAEEPPAPRVLLPLPYRVHRCAVRPIGEHLRGEHRQQHTQKQTNR